MEFIDTAYVILIPFIVLLSLIVKNQYKDYCINIISAANVLLILNAVFILRQFLALYYLGKRLGFDTSDKSIDLISYLGKTFYLQLAIIILPFIFLHKKLSGNRWLTVVMLILFISLYRNTFFYYLSTNIFSWLNYFCLLIAAYALLWLLKRLPYSSL
jgi:hypothetical protein